MSTTMQERPSLDMGKVRTWYHDEGLSLRDIAARTGYPSKTVHRHMIKAGIERREPGGNLRAGTAPVTAQESADIAAYFAANPATTYEAAARHFRRSERVIAKHAQCPPRRPCFSETDFELVRQARRRGLHGVQIDRELGWSRGRAGAIQKRLGLDPQLPLPPTADLDRMYTRLGSVAAVAAELRVGSRRVRGALVDAGCTIGGRGIWPPHPLDPHLDAIRAAYVGERAHTRDLAARYGCTPGVMRGFLTSRGITRYRRLTGADRETIRSLAAQGLPKAAIARELGVTGPTVANCLSQNATP